VQLKDAVLARPWVQTPVLPKKEKIKLLGVYNKLITPPQDSEAHFHCNYSSFHGDMHAAIQYFS
jgi:hypothetical protein